MTAILEFEETGLPCPCGYHENAFARNKDGSGKCFSTHCNQKFFFPLDFWEHFAKCTPRTYASRGVRPEIGAKFGAKEYVDEHGTVQFFEFPDAKTGRSKVIRVLDKNSQWSGTKGDPTPALGPWGYYDKGTVRNAYVVEGEKDFLAAYQMLNSGKAQTETHVYYIPSAGVPKKARQEIFETLKDYERIIVASEGDEAGLQTREVFSALFGNKMRTVELTKHKDANDYLMAGDEADFKRACTNYTRFTPEFIFNGEGQLSKLWDEKEADFYVPTPFEGLNELIKGVPLGHVTLIAGPEGLGKQLPIDTPIPTPYGFTPMGSLKVGDTVFGKDGKPCKVTYVTETQYGIPCYKIVFADGTEQIAGGPHKWGVYCSSSGNYLVKTTEEIFKEGPLRGDVARYSVDITKPVEFGLPPVGIDPYIVGYWLGDGHSYSANITVGKEDLNEFSSIISNRGGSIEHIKTDSRGNYSIRVSSLRHKDLRNLNLIKNKHIPESYLFGPVDDRWELLRGLMDSDGSVHVMGACEFYSSNWNLFKDFLVLARGLGLKVRWRKKESKLYGKSCGLTYRAWFLVNEEVPFCFRRKFLKVVPCKTYRKNRKTIRQIVPVESVPSKCIQVDSPDHLYLCGEHFTVTHNTELLRSFEWRVLDKVRKEGHGVSVTHFEESSKTILKGFGCYDQQRNFRDPDKVYTLNDIYPTIQKLADDFYITDFYKARDEMSVSSFMEKIKYLHDVCGVRWFFIDPINQLRPDNDEETLEKFLTGLARDLERFCVDHHCACVWTAHVNDDGQTRDSRMIAKLASIRINLSRDEETGQVSMYVDKNRPFSRRGPAGYIGFDEATFTLYDPSNFMANQHDEGSVEAVDPSFGRQTVRPTVRANHKIKGSRGF